MNFNPAGPYSYLCGTNLFAPQNKYQKQEKKTIIFLKIKNKGEGGVSTRQEKQGVMPKRNREKKGKKRRKKLVYFIV